MHERTFILKHVVSEFSKMKDEEYRKGVVKEHFGVPWSISVDHDSESVQVYLTVDKDKDDKKQWTVDVDYKFRLDSVVGKAPPQRETGSHRFLSGERMTHVVKVLLRDDVIDKYSVDDTVVFKCEVTVRKMTGIVHKQMNFDAPKTNLTDTAMEVEGRCFHISIAFLATHSSWSDINFLIPSKVSSAKLILKDVNADDFQCLLEVLHGKSSIYEENVEKLLTVADQFGVEIVKERCIDFLMFYDKLPTKEKLRIADIHKLDDLRNHFIETIKSMDDARALLSLDLDQFSDSTLAAVFRTTYMPRNPYRPLKKCERHFTLRHVVTNFPETNYEWSKKEEHFSVPWRMFLAREDEYFSAYLQCDKEDDPKKPWSIDFDFEIRMVSKSGKEKSKGQISMKFEKKIGWGFPSFHPWDDVIKNFMVDDTVIIEIDVTIKKMTGIVHKKNINFGRSKKALTDTAVLIVGNEKFFIPKVFLATHSPWFEKRFFGHCAKSKDASKVDLENVNADDLQCLLEVLYGKSSIYEENVENLLTLANRFNFEMVKNRCVDFLIHNSLIANKEKFRIADAHRLDILKDHCLKQTKSMDDVKSLLPADIKNFDESTLAALFRVTIHPSWND